MPGWQRIRPPPTAGASPPPSPLRAALQLLTLAALVVPRRCPCRICPACYLELPGFPLRSLLALVVLRSLLVRASECWKCQK